MKKIILLTFLAILSFNSFAQTDVTLKVNFGAKIDSVYTELSDRYGTENITPMEGSKNPFNKLSDSDSLLLLKQPVVLFDNEAKTTKCSFLSFQKDKGKSLRLNQIAHLISEVPKDFKDIIPSVYDSYYKHYQPLYDDIEYYYNDNSQKCFRFGKALYSEGTWFGTYFVTETSKNYQFWLIFTVPQYNK